MSRVFNVGALRHDIGKVWRCDPAKVGMPSIRHPGFGVPICLTVDRWRALLSSRSIEGTIVRWADHSFWLILEKAGQAPR